MSKGEESLTLTAKGVGARQCIHLKAMVRISAIQLFYPISVHFIQNSVEFYPESKIGFQEDMPIEVI